MNFSLWPRVLFLLVFGWNLHAIADAVPTTGPLPDPSARLLEGDDASEYWTLFIELETGHRISQRFLLTNAGPGEHTAVAVGHLVEPGREPYRYENGRRRSRWSLSEDRLFFDIAASHLDLHRPRGQLLITKDDIEIRLHFDFERSDLAARVPRSRLPAGYFVDLLAVATPTSGTIHAPWMDAPRPATGRTWLAHTWTEKSEARVIRRRVDFFAQRGGRALYGLQLETPNGNTSHYFLGRDRWGRMLESPINVETALIESARAEAVRGSSSYPLPGDFRLDSAGGMHGSGRITLRNEWLRFDPLSVIPNPFRWFVRRVTKPQEVWADAEFEGTLWAASGSPSIPPAGANANRIEDQSPANRAPASERETEKGSATGSVTGVASITFTNPIDRR